MRLIRTKTFHHPVIERQISIPSPHQVSTSQYQCGQYEGIIVTVSAIYWLGWVLNAVGGCRYWPVR